MTRIERWTARLQFFCSFSDFVQNQPAEEQKDGTECGALGLLNYLRHSVIKKPIILKC